MNMLSVAALSKPGDFAREFQRCCCTYAELHIASAWCGDPKNILPYSYLEKFGGKIVATIGVSFDHTHPDSIEFLKKIGADVRVFRLDSELFHPKVYLFSKNDTIALFVGSSNFTYSGFFENVETNILLEGIPEGEPKNQVAELREQMNQWRSDSNSFAPSASWLNSYRRTYANSARSQRKHKILTPPRVEEEIASASWLRNADWEIYYREVVKGLKRHDRTGRGYHEVLDAAVKQLPIPWKTSYFEDLEKRKIIGGIEPFGWLGHVAASGQFRHLMRCGPQKQWATIVKAINRIAGLNHPLRWAELESNLSELCDLGPTMKVWGRLLCIVRPDLYCTVASPSVRQRLSETLGVPQRSFARLDGYICLVKLVHASPWFNSKKPQDEGHAAIWQRRAAFMDAIFY